ncbi:MAG TPA: ATP-grasp fold amidoligase family protein [Sedimentibacter sp.]|nr:ATP-grasp fold amidoligase family protein [Sedimentibacter sp.]
MTAKDKIISYIKNPFLIIPFLGFRGFFHWIPDALWLKIVFRIKMGYKLDLNNPKTFNEKLQWLKLHDRNPLYTTLVDKYEVRKYITETIGEEYLIPLLGVWEHFDDIDFDKLPNQFVLKCTHDSGGLIICTDKSKLNIKAAKKKINSCLKRNYYWAFREWPYKNVKPRIIAEKYMVDESGTELKDYKIMCFGGEPKCSFVCSERFKSNLKVTIFDISWNRLPFTRDYPASDNEIQKPLQYAKMLEFSKILSKEIRFLRVDFYEINNQVYMGELTFYPGSGLESFNPKEWDYKFGKKMVL